MLHIENLNFSIKGKKLLSDISFSNDKGQVRVFIGPNGAGKSTLLKNIANVYKRQQGKVLLDMLELGELTTKELSKIIAYMPQFNEVPNISVLEVLELGRYTYSGSKIQKEDRTIINEVIENFSMQNILSKNISTLSGGQRQKVFLASCLIQQPKVLMLDEPISHLDPKNQLDVLQTIRKLTKEKGIITLIVLHDIQHALHYGDNLLMMKDARVAYDITTKVIEERHLNEVFDVHAKLFKQEHHTFVYYEHSHLKKDKKHSHE
jgi:iron complex transport system ATP-binding protein